MKVPPFIQSFMISTTPEFNRYYRMREDGQAEPVRMLDWLATGSYGGRDEERRVGWTQYRDGPQVLLVSTVFLALDHGPLSFNLQRPDYKPLLWETMISRGDEWDNENQLRYHSLAEAFEGHKKMVQEVFGDNPPPTRWGKYVYTAGLLGVAAEAAWRLSDG